MGRYDDVAKVAAEVYWRGGNPDTVDDERIADNLAHNRMDIFEAADVECRHQNQQRLERQYQEEQRYIDEEEYWEQLQEDDI